MAGFLDYRSFAALSATSPLIEHLLMDPANAELIRRAARCLRLRNEARRLGDEASFIREVAAHDFSSDDRTKADFIAELQTIAKCIFGGTSAATGAIALFHYVNDTPVSWSNLGHWRHIASPVIDIAFVSLLVILVCRLILAPSYNMRDEFLRARRTASDLEMRGWLAGRQANEHLLRLNEQEEHVGRAPTAPAAPERHEPLRMVLPPDA